MLSTKILGLLNNQIKLEQESAQLYLSMHAWADDYGLEGTAKWFLQQYKEELTHAEKFLPYITAQNARAIIPDVKKPEQEFKDLKTVFEATYAHELFITEHLNKIAVEALKEYDIMTANFMKWYLDEQIEEQTNVIRILDRIKNGGDCKAGPALLLVDSFIGNIR